VCRSAPRFFAPSSQVAAAAVAVCCATATVAASAAAAVVVVVLLFQCFQIHSTGRILRVRSLSRSLPCSLDVVGVQSEVVDSVDGVGGSGSDDAWKRFLLLLYLPFGRRGGRCISAQLQLAGRLGYTVQEEVDIKKEVLCEVFDECFKHC
jgi:hypothetical protein